MPCPQKMMFRHIIFRLQKSKDKEKKSWKKPEGKKPYLQNKDKNYIQLLLNNHTRKESGMKYFMCQEEKTYQPRILYPVKLSFQSEGEIKTFSDKWKFEGICSRPSLQEILKEFL